MNKIKKFFIPLVIIVLLIGGGVVFYFSPMNEQARFESQVASYIGLPDKEARKKASKDGLKYRIISEDGQRQGITDDFQAKRINIYLEHGKVVDARSDKSLNAQ